MSLSTIEMFWEQFGVIATDLQRINIELRHTGSGRVTFWNADAVLQDRMQLEGLSHTERQALSSLREGCRKALQAAESMAPWHRTRLIAQAGSALGSAVQGHAVLEWKQPPSSPPAERLPLKDFVQGRWTGRTLVRDPGYNRFAQDLGRASDQILQSCKKLAPTHEIQLTLRTF